MIAANRGIGYVDQSFSPFLASPAVKAALPVVESSQFIHLTGEDEERVRAFLDRIFCGNLRVNAPWEFWKSSFDFFSDRLVLKILAAKSLIDWIDQRFDVHVVYSTRHPIPTALSVIRNHWSLTAPAFLKNRHFTQTYLNEETTQRCWKILESGTLLEKHALNWALENLIPIQLLPYRPHWTFVSFEEAILHPDAVIERLSQRLSLSDSDRMRDHVRRPSRSTKTLDSTYSPTEEAESRLANWRKDVSESEAQAALDICQVLGITLYSHDSPVIVRDPTQRNQPN